MNIKNFKIEETLGCLIAKISANFKIHYTRKLKSLGFEITPEQFGILLKLQEENGLYQKQLADKLLKDKPNITRIIDILEERELVYRKSDKQDRRKFKIFITEKGENLTNEILPVLIDNAKIFRTFITEEEENTLKKILSKLNNAFEKETYDNDGD